MTVSPFYVSPGRRALCRFLEGNQCPHCSGVTSAAWALAGKFAALEGEMFMLPLQPPICTGLHEHIGDLTADQLEQIVLTFPSRSQTERYRGDQTAIGGTT